jgi:hypothetical protein
MELATNNKYKRRNESRDAMEKKWCLLKESDGARGDAGKKKVYEVVVKDNMLFTSWGMAEKSVRASSTKFFASENAAVAEALDKIHSKLDKGYKLAFVV